MSAEEYAYAQEFTRNLDRINEELIASTSFQWESGFNPNATIKLEESLILPYQNISSIWDRIPMAEELASEPQNNRLPPNFGATPYPTSSPPSLPPLPPLPQYFDPSNLGEVLNDTIEEYDQFSRHSNQRALMPVPPFPPNQFQLPSNNFNLEMTPTNHYEESITSSPPPNSSPIASSSSSSTSHPSPSSPRNLVMPYRAGGNPFVSKLYWILEQEEHSGFIRWDTDGNTFVVEINNVRFINEVLSTYFNHTSATSFCRQLQLYSFDRLSTREVQAALQTTDADIGSDWRAYKHELMKRDDASQLHRMKPRQSKARINKRNQNAERRKSTDKDVGGGGGDEGGGASGSCSPTSQISSPPSASGSLFGD